MSKHKINKVIILLKVKVEITASGDNGDKDLLPKFLLLREVRLRLERVWNTMLTRSQRGPPYSPHALTNARCRDSTNGALKAHTKPLQSRMELLHNKPETPTNTPKLHHNGMWLRGCHKLSRTPSPKSNKLKSANTLKRNYLLNFTYHYNESSGKTQTDAPNAIEEHTKCSSSPLSNPTKATKAMEEYERKNKENTKNSKI